MLFSRYMSLNVISIENRLITPIAKLDGFIIEDEYVLFNYSVVAFIIDENGTRYHINLSLSQNNFIRLKNNELFN